MRHLPLGIQTFRTIINEGYLYVDKTEYIYNIISRGQYFFLSRPRRFGKSLLVSTLKELFSGNKHLFENLWIAQSDYKWISYPVIHLDFSRIAHRAPQEFEAKLIHHIRRIASEYNIDLPLSSSPERALDNLIVILAKKNPVVIIIDEYDKPILDHLHDREAARAQQSILISFYGVIKNLEAYLRFIFLTGITKFSQTSVFSGLNNLQDLTLDPQAAPLLGYTYKEIDTYFGPHINHIAAKHNVSYSVIRENIRTWYNGYQFSKKHLKVYNPYSVLLYLSSKRLLNYWFSTGTPSFLVQLITTQQYPIEAIEGAKVNVLDIDSLELDTMKLIPLLLQTGYLTIASYDEHTSDYMLTYPNEETKVSFLHYFVTSLTTAPVSLFRSSVLALTRALKNNNIDLFFYTLQGFFAAIPYTMQLPQEKYYQSIFYVITSLIGVYIQTDVATCDGRIDATIETNSHIYIIEFKLNQSATTALEQIEKKRYHQKYLSCNKRIVLIGANFSFEKRNVAQWIAEGFLPYA
jgi:Predicted AAA-ATPase/PD-(D/E)XK nuclease superfamily